MRHSRLQRVQGEKTCHLLRSLQSILGCDGQQLLVEGEKEEMGSRLQMNTINLIILALTTGLSLERKPNPN